MARLRESNAEDLDGNGTDAPKRAEEQLRSVLGEQKARELATLANEYWSKGDTTEASDDTTQMLKGPNAVPSDTRVVVNIPAFRMDLFQDGSLVKSYKVGIGYPEFPLPQGLRKAQQIIFNPTWTPPDSPWVAKMKNVTPGETVEAGDKHNPLGPIKIPIGLPSLIHGGKSAGEDRKVCFTRVCGTHECADQGFRSAARRKRQTRRTSLNKIDSYLEDKEKTQTVKLNQTVPVELRYETIVLEDGKLHIYKDVYAQDTNTEENLRSVLEAHGLKLEDLSQQQRHADAVNALKAVKKDRDRSGHAWRRRDIRRRLNLDNGTWKNRGSNPRRGLNGSGIRRSREWALLNRWPGLAVVGAAGFDRFEILFNAIEHFFNRV